MRLARVDLRPSRPRNFADIDVAVRVDGEAVRRQKLAGLGPGRRVAEAADQIALMIDDADPWAEIGNIAADRGRRADFADIADRLMAVRHVEAAGAVQVL